MTHYTILIKFFYIVATVSTYIIDSSNFRP